MAALYRRRVSGTEARDGHVMITKDRVRRFPPPGVPFSLRRNGVDETASIDALDCTCRGPELPHQHWFLAWPGLRGGDVIEIEQAGDGFAGRVVDGPSGARR